MGVVVKQSIKGTIVNYLGVAIGAFTTFFILTRYLTAEEVGLTRVLVEAATLLSGLSQLGTSASILRYYPYFKDEKNKDNGFFFWSIVIPLIGFALFSLVYVILKTPITSYFAEKSELFNSFYFYVLPLAFFLLYVTVFEANANVLLRIVVPKFVREVLVRVLSLGCYLIYAFRLISLEGFVIAFCGVYAVAMIIDIVYLFRLGKISIRPNYAFLTPEIKRNYLFYTAFLVVASLATTITPFLNTFFISAKMGLTFTGIYTIAVFIASVIEVPYRSLGAISQPHISQAVKDNDIAEVNKLCKSVSLHQLLVGGFIFIVIWINIDFIFAVIPNGSVYESGKWVVFFLGITKLVYSTLNVGITVLSFSKYYYNSLIFTVVLTVTAIVFNILFIPQWGMTGAAFATLLSNVIYYLLMLGYNKIRIKTSPFSYKQIVVIALMCFLLFINYLWSRLVSPNIMELFDTTVLAMFADFVLKTMLISILSLVLVYNMKISENINQIIDKCLIKIRIRK